MPVIGITSQTLHSTQSMSGSATAVRRFAKQNREPVEKVVGWLTADADEQRTTILSYKPDDSAWPIPSDLYRIMDYAPAHGDVLFAYFHEPEDDIAVGTLSLTDWLVAQNRLYDAMPPSWALVPTLMSWTFADASGRNPADYLPARFDHLGIDHYPERVTQQDVWSRILNAADGRGVVLAEFGIHHGTPDEKLAAFVDQSEANGVVAATYFDVDRSDVENDPEKDWRLDDTTRYALGLYARGRI